MDLDESQSNTASMSKENVKMAFDSLLASMEDYNTDRRGDVGSWCRIAAMNGLVSLTTLAVAADDHIGEARYFDEFLCIRVIGALFKQLSEKLDNVRQCAGFCLERLVCNRVPSIPFIPSRSVLEEAFGFAKICSDENQHINWANPAVTFPMVMQAANVVELFEYIISGMVISVGGLTESVTKCSTSAMLDWTRSSKGTDGATKVKKLGKALLALFDRHRKDGRVVLPLLKTLNVLLSHGSLGGLITRDTSATYFPSSLMSQLRVECKGCCDVQRLVASVSVALGLLASDQTDILQEDVLPFLMTMLAHRYPRVRRWTAEQLYVRLLEDGSVVSKEVEQDSSLEQAMQLLLEVAWNDGLDPPGNVRESRNRVADLLGINLSERERAGIHKNKGKSAAVVDEFESYASLVDAAGR